MKKYQFNVTRIYKGESTTQQYFNITRFKAYILKRILLEAHKYGATDEIIFTLMEA